MQKKTVEQIFQNFDFNFFLQIFEILHLDLISAAAAVKLSKPTGLTS